MTALQYADRAARPAQVRLGRHVLAGVIDFAFAAALIACCLAVASLTKFRVLNDLCFAIIPLISAANEAFWPRLGSRLTSTELVQTRGGVTSPWMRLFRAPVVLPAFWFGLGIDLLLAMNKFTADDGTRPYPKIETAINVFLPCFLLLLVLAVVDLLLLLATGRRLVDRLLGLTVIDLRAAPSASP